MEFAESKRGKYIGLGTVYLIALALMLYGMLGGMHTADSGKVDFDKTLMIALYVPLSCIFVIKLLFDFLFCRFEKNVFLIFSIIFGVFHFYSVEALVAGIMAKTPLYVVFIACCISGLAIPFSRLVSLAIQGVIASLNIGFHGEKPMRLWRKIAEVFLQIALLPLSVILQVMAIPYAVIGFILLEELIIRHLFYKSMKKFSDWEYQGNLLYDFFVLPCRVISLLFSIIALFVPNMFVSVIRPNTDYQYNTKAFKYLDVIAFDIEKYKKEEETSEEIIEEDMSGGSKEIEL